MTLAFGILLFAPKRLRYRHLVVLYHQLQVNIASYWLEKIKRKKHGRGKMPERRQSQRRVTAERRKGHRRVMQVPVETERRVRGERRRGERRVTGERRKGEGGR